MKEYIVSSCGNVENLFEETNFIFKFLNMIIVQFKLTELVSSASSAVFYLLPFSSAIYLMFKAITDGEKKTKRKGTKFTVFCIFVLFFLILFFGLVFTTDKARWFCHALIAVTSYFLITSFEEKQYAEAFENETNKVSKNFMWMYALVIFIVYMDVI